MSKCTEGAPGAVACVLDIITLRRLVDLGVKLLLGASVTVLAVVPTITVGGVSPLVSTLHRGARRGPVLVLPGAPSPVFIVVELRTGVSLSAQSRWFLARLSFVVRQDVRRVQPLGVVIEQRPLLVQAVGPELVIVAVNHLPLLPAVVHWWSEIICTVCECTMGAIFDAVTSAIIVRIIWCSPSLLCSPVVCVVDTHASLVISQVVSPLRVARRPVQELTPEHDHLVTVGWWMSVSIKG